MQVQCFVIPTPKVSPFIGNVRVVLKPKAQGRVDIGLFSMRQE